MLLHAVLYSTPPLSWYLFPLLLLPYLFPLFLPLPFPLPLYVAPTSIGAEPPTRLVPTAEEECCWSLGHHNAVVVLQYSMIVVLSSAKVGVVPALRCRFFGSVPVVSFMRTAIFTWPGSCALLSH